MTDIRLTGVPEELAARIEAAWQRSVEQVPNDDLEWYWAETVERAEVLAAAYQELFELGISGLLVKLVIDARNGARSDAREARRELARARQSSGQAVSS